MYFGVEMVAKKSKKGMNALCILLSYEGLWINTIGIKVVGFDQLFRNPPSKPSNVQIDEGLFQTKLILEVITTSSLIPKSKNCHWGKYEMKNLTSPNMANPFN